MKRTTKSFFITVTTATIGLSVLIVGTASGQNAGRKEAQRKFKQLDANKSGLIEREEFPGDDQLFKRADRDGNTTIDFEEALEFIIEMEVEKIFMKLDKDRDGFIQREELQDAEQRRNFAELDSDGDSQVSGEELLVAVRRKFSEDTMKGPKKIKAPKMPPSWDEIVRADSNGNGTLEPEELLDAPAGSFEKIDADKDGKITREEYEALRKRVVTILDTTHELSVLLQTRLDRVGKALKKVEIDEAERLLEQLKKELRQIVKKRQGF